MVGGTSTWPPNQNFSENQHQKPPSDASYPDPLHSERPSDWGERSAEDRGAPKESPTNRPAEFTKTEKSCEGAAPLPRSTVPSGFRQPSPDNAGGPPLAATTSPPNPNDPKAAAELPPASALATEPPSGPPSGPASSERAGAPALGPPSAEDDPTEHPRPGNARATQPPPSAPQAQQGPTAAPSQPQSSGRATPPPVPDEGPVCCFPGCIVRPGKKIYPTPERNEVTPKHDEADFLEAARRVAMVLAVHGEPGFDIVRIVRRMDPVPEDRKTREIPDHADRAKWETLYRLFMLADHDRVPQGLRDAARRAGGVCLEKREYDPAKGELPIGYCDTHACGRLCDFLKSMHDNWTKANPNWNPPSWLIQGRKNLFDDLGNNDQKRAWIVGAALSAADAVAALEDHVNSQGQTPWKRHWNDRVGGRCGRGDLATPWINQWMTEFRSQPCRCESCTRKWGPCGYLYAAAAQKTKHDPQPRQPIPVHARSPSTTANTAGAANPGEIPLPCTTGLTTPVTPLPSVTTAPAAPDTAAHNPNTATARSFYTQGGFDARSFHDP